MKREIEAAERGTPRDPFVQAAGKVADVASKGTKAFRDNIPGGKYFIPNYLTPEVGQNPRLVDVENNLNGKTTHQPVGPFSPQAVEDAGEAVKKWAMGDDPARVGILKGEWKPPATQVAKEAPAPVTPAQVTQVAKEAPTPVTPTPVTPTPVTPTQPPTQPQATAATPTASPSAAPAVGTTTTGVGGGQQGAAKTIPASNSQAGKQVQQAPAPARTSAPIPGGKGKTGTPKPR